MKAAGSFTGAKVLVNRSSSDAQLALEVIMRLNTPNKKYDSLRRGGFSERQPEGFVFTG